MCHTRKPMRPYPNFLATTAFELCVAFFPKSLHRGFTKGRTNCARQHLHTVNLRPVR